MNIPQKGSMYTDADIKAVVNAEMQRNYLSGAPKVPPHNHDGNTNLKVSAINLINSPAYVYTALFTQNTNTILTIGPNASQIFCTGEINSNVPATFYCTFTGTAQIGNIFSNEAPLGQGVQAPTNPTSLAPTPAGSVQVGVTQSCNWFAYEPGTGGAFAGTDASALIFTTDSTSATLATGVLDKLFNTGIELKMTVPTGFTLRVAFIIT